MTSEELSRNLATARQGAAVATAFMLPLSTSGQAIAVSILAILALLTLDRVHFVATMRTAPAYLPVLLFGLVVVGVLWSNQPLPLAIKWIGPYAKLLLIPLLLASAFTPRQALQIGAGFIAACVVLLILSWASFLWPAGPWTWFKAPGVPVKDNAVQSGCFALCAFGLAMAAVRIWTQGDRRRAVAMIVLALLFFADVFLIYLSKTGAIMAAALLGLFVIHAGGWRRSLMIAVPAVLIMVVALWASAPAQRRLAEISTDINAGSGSSGGVETISTGARIDFWTKGAEFLKQRPLFGHGTGSIKPLYQSLEATRPSPYGEATPDPHNQFLHIALQLGLVGGALLLAMWAVHMMMFKHRDFASVLGQAIVLQNFVGSLFNSHLSAVTQGMLYCLAVGLLGAVMRGARAIGSDRNQASPPATSIPATASDSAV
jgi:O-antigen ligase